MKIHEYQAKELFRRYAIPVGRSQMVENFQQGIEAVKEIGLPCVIKAQVQAGGRGKAGGIKLVKEMSEFAPLLDSILSMTLVSRQTGPQGKKVRKVLIEEALPIKRELYLALLLDREREQMVFIASAAGGMEIEELAAREPQKIIREYISPIVGLTEAQCRYLAKELGLPRQNEQEFVQLLQNMYRLYFDKDCSLVEINPLILTEDYRIVALDAKINFDDNGLFRHPEIAELRDIFEEEPLEVEASKYHLNYIKLDGNIGCMVNGAGLAMATMDMIKYCGGEPANFLDVGGGTSVERIREAFRILLSDQNVRAVLVNIFGGIVRTDLVASGMVQALKNIELKVPVVVRLVGTNEKEGREILSSSGLKLESETDLLQAVQKAVRLAAEVH